MASDDRHRSNFIGRPHPDSLAAFLFELYPQWRVAEYRIFHIALAVQYSEDVTLALRDAGLPLNNIANPNEAYGWAVDHMLQSLHAAYDRAAVRRWRDYPAAKPGEPYDRRTVCAAVAAVHRAMGRSPAHTAKLLNEGVPTAFRGACRITRDHVRSCCESFGHMVERHRVATGGDAEDVRVSLEGDAQDARGMLELYENARTVPALQKFRGAALARAIVAHPNFVSIVDHASVLEWEKRRAPKACA